jgi:hypothetical protein
LNPGVALHLFSPWQIQQDCANFIASVSQINRPPVLFNGCIAVYGKISLATDSRQELAERGIYLKLKRLEFVIVLVFAHHFVRKNPW